MKKRLKDEGNETDTNCNSLKSKVQDGKYRETDITDIEEKEVKKISKPKKEDKNGE